MDSRQNQAWVTSLRLLAATPKTRRELAKKLSDKGFPEPLVEETLDKMEAQGLLSDLAYAKNLAARLTHEKPSGRRKLSFELKRHGVPAKIQEEILSGITPADEAARALEIASSQWQRFEKLEPEKRKKRVYDLLIRRGFDFDIVRDAVEKLESQSDAG